VRFFAFYPADPYTGYGSALKNQKIPSSMQIDITLPGGKTLEITKGENGCHKLFTTPSGEIVATYDDRVMKFGGMPYVITYSKETDTE